MSAAGLIVSALIAAAGTGIAAGVSAKSQREAQEEARRLAETRRGDELDIFGKGQDLSREGLAQQRQLTMMNLAAQKEEAALGRQERTEERAYQRKKDVYNNALALLNNNVALQERMSKYWGSR